MRAQRTIMALPIALLVALSAWHFYSFFTLNPLGNLMQHVGLTALAICMMLAALFFRDRIGESGRYVEGLISPFRPHLVGAACFILGGLHFVTLPEEGVFLKMGYLTMILAMLEIAGIAEKFLPALTGEAAAATVGTLKRLMLRQAGMLVVVFLLAVVLLYMSLMVVVGFTETWTVALLAAMMLAALAFMAMVRRI